ncbi:hypothetical protein L7F22_002376 [Adiantum nelumboides]|nr:hypothetical protein [Adiantum nelumboides]
MLIAATSEFFEIIVCKEVELSFVGCPSSHFQQQSGFERGFCGCAGIYVGDDSVIHFTRGQGVETGTGTCLDKIFSSSLSPSQTSSPCTKCAVNFGSNGVVLTCLECFLSGQVLYRFQYSENALTFFAKARGGMCTLAMSDAPETVLHRSQYLLANGFGCYHIFQNNCEDFAVYCKTGLLVVERRSIGRSGQAVSFLGAPLAAVFSSPLRFIVAQSWGCIVVSVGMYCLSRYAADVGVRKDVAKIAVEDLAVRLRPSMQILQADAQSDVVNPSGSEKEVCSG